MLSVAPGGFYVDGTVGFAGHAAAVLEASAPDGRLLGCDRDGETLVDARETLAAYGDRVRLLHSDFRALSVEHLAAAPNGVLLDLGVNSRQLDDPARGFSFRNDGPLDMRFDRQAGAAAAEAVHRLPERALADVIYRFGEERASRRIARAIVAARRRGPLTTTLELAAVVRAAAPRSGRKGLDPATRTFQALRIYVNQELDGLDVAVQSLAQRLAPGGRMVVISFHSLEDRQIKHAFRDLAREGGFRLLTRKPVRPGAAELADNPRARSARLRALVREEQAA